MTLVLTTDELRVSATIQGGRLPVTLDSGWSTADLPVADVVALRGLLARGLATAHDTDVTLTGALTGTVASLLSAGAFVEARRDCSDRPMRWLIARTTGGTLSCVEHRPDLWHIESRGENPAEPLLAELAGQLPESAPDGQPVLVPTGLLVEAERLAATDGTRLPAMLADRGLRPADARQVSGILCGLRATVTVRSVQRNGSVLACEALTWLESTSGVWLAVPGEDAGEAPASHTELRPVDRSGLLAELRDLLDELTDRSAG